MVIRPHIRFLFFSSTYNKHHFPKLHPSTVLSHAMAESMCLRCERDLLETFGNYLIACLN